MTSRWAAVAAIGLAALIGMSTVTALAARTAAHPFGLTFDGRHEADAESPVGFRHVGPFTASDPFCASGQARTLGGTDTAPLTRLLICEDGSGTASAFFMPPDSEHGGSGTWRIVSGTGKYEKLRGHGRFTSVRTGGDPLDHGSITFRSEWTGLADLDDAPPAIAFASATAAKLRRPAGTYSIKLALALSDDTAENSVSYTLRVTTLSGIELARRFGTATTPTVSLTLRIRPQNARVKAVRLHLAGEDPIGNTQSLTRALRLPK